jgi:hypothetical protein
VTRAVPDRHRPAPVALSTGAGSSTPTAAAGTPQRRSPGTTGLLERDRP